ncbi:hypothetical protein OXX69_000974 [Metschnikowia pulcherrima]
MANEEDFFRSTNVDGPVASRRSPSPKRSRSVSSRGVIMPSLNKRQKKNTDGPCFNENVRLRFIHNLNRKSSICRVMTIEKYNNIVSLLTSGRDSPSPEGLRGYHLENYRRKCRRIRHLYYLEGGKLVLRTKEGPKDCVMAHTILDVIDRAHASLAHAGIHKTFDEIRGEHYGITRKDVQWLLKRCSSCQTRRANSTRAPLQPIESNAPMERVQIDLVDLRFDTSEGHKWFLHVKDHFTKLSMLYPLYSKHAEGIAKCLEEFIRFYGPPEIVQCDNGMEFKGAVERVLLFYGVKIINGRPRTPRVQGLVEKANGVVKHKMAIWKKQNKRTDWHDSLSFIESAINRSSCKGLPRNLNPHKALFGHSRRGEYDFMRKQMELSDSEIDRIVSSQL